MLASPGGCSKHPLASWPQQVAMSNQGGRSKCLNGVVFLILNWTSRVWPGLLRVQKLRTCCRQHASFYPCTLAPHCLADPSPAWVLGCAEKNDCEAMDGAHASRRLTSCSSMACSLSPSLQLDVLGSLSLANWFELPFTHTEKSV